MELPMNRVDLVARKARMVIAALVGLLAWYRRRLALQPVRVSRHGARDF
jgi:hypothetical protein